MKRYKLILCTAVTSLMLIGSTIGAHALESPLPTQSEHAAKPKVPSVPIVVPGGSAGTPSLPQVNTTYPSKAFQYQHCQAQNRLPKPSAQGSCEAPPPPSEPAKEKCYDWVQTFSDTHKYDGNRYTFKQAFSWCGKGQVITKITYNRCWHVDGYFNYKGCGLNQAAMGTPDIQGGVGDGWVTVRSTWSYWIETPSGTIWRHPHTEWKFFAHGNSSGTVVYP